MLSLIGGSIGLALARWGVDLILYMSPDAIPRSREIGLDWTVLAFTAGISVLTGLIFGLLPALQAGDASCDPNDVCSCGRRQAVSPSDVDDGVISAALTGAGVSPCAPITSGRQRPWELLPREQLPIDMSTLPR